jgi:integrase
VRRKTTRSYQQFVTLHLKLGLGRIRLTKLTPGHVRTLLEEQAGLSVRTVTLMRDVLRIALNQAVTDGAAARNVAALVKRPKPTRRQGPILSPNQVPVFLSRIKGTRLAPMITIGLAVGLRLGEVLGLQWSAVDLEEGVIRVERGLETIGRDRSLVALKSKESRRTARWGSAGRDLGRDGPDERLVDDSGCAEQERFGSPCVTLPPRRSRW